MNEVGFNGEFEKLKLRHGALKERVANEIEMYTHLITTKGPNIEAKYMMLVGQLEYQALALDMEARRWKRRFALRQMYINRGEKPDLIAIESLLDEEFAEWKEKLAALAVKLDGSKLQFDATKLSESDTNAIRCDYLNAVKKLHPDLNKDLSEAAKSLWNQIQKAYAAKDWHQLRFLVSLVDEVVAGTAQFAATPDCLEKLKSACEMLETKSQEVSQQIAELKAKAPFTYEVLLDDPVLLERKRNAIKAKLKEMKTAIEKYERRWNNG